MISKKMIALGMTALTAGSLFAGDQGQTAQPMGMERPPQREITPNAAPRVSDGADVFLTVDFIYWKAHQDGLNYASSGVLGTTLGNVAPVTTTGSVFEPNFKFKPGFKVGAGLDLGHDGWDLYLNYTWFRSNKNSSSFTQPDYNVNLAYDNAANSFVTGGILSSNPPFNLSASWKLNSFNVLDLELARNFYISKYLTMRPYVGFKGTWQKQRYDLSLTGQNAVTTFIDTFATNLRQKFYGFGMRAGMNTAWYFCKNFSIYGDVNATALWSRFKDSRYSANSDALLGTTVTVNNKQRMDTLTPVLEFGIGLRGETWFYDDNYHFAAEIGWEEQIWFGMNNFYTTSTPLVRPDLALHGLTVKVRFDF